MSRRWRKLRKGAIEALRKAPGWAFGVAGSVLAGLIVAQLGGYIHLNALLEGGQLFGKEPSLIEQRQTVIASALDDGQVLAEQKQAVLESNGSLDWLVLFESERGSDEMRIYRTRDGELTEAFKFRPRITLKPGRRSEAVDIYIDPVRDYDGDGRPDVVGAFVRRDRWSNPGLRPFFLRYLPRRGEFVPYPLLAKRLDVSYGSPIHLPSGATVPKGRVFPFQPAALIEDSSVGEGFLYEGMWSYLVAKSDRFRGAIVITALSPKRVDSGYRWDLDAWSVGLLSEKLGATPCFFDDFVTSFTSPTPYPGDSDKELRKRFTHVSMCL